MTTAEDLPNPENCLWCQEARNCTTSAFHSQMLLDPLIPAEQTLQQYLSKLCDCGHQLVPHFAEGSDIPEFIPHTKLCKEHTIRWMEKVIQLQKEYASKHN